ncbi:MAG: indole-3-glycerol phosphate synthase TrpC [Acidimicrobiales bacterium]
MPTYLDRILAAHRAAAAAERRDVAALIRSAADAAPVRGFAAALVRSPDLAVIAEVKRHSPSRGDLDRGLDPRSLARDYQRGGAAAVSVLTDSEFFHGSPADLIAARAAVELPVLRKDFTVSPADVCDARLMGADAVLLIAAALSPEELQALLDLSRQLGIDALVEIHDEDEAERTLAAGATLIGINQRNLVSFEVDPARAERLVKVLPDGVVRVAESGIRSGEDARRLAAAGFDAVLVGESLVTAGDPARAVRDLRRPR